jgi:PKD domain
MYSTLANPSPWRFLVATAAFAVLCAAALVCAPAARTEPVNDIAADFGWSPTTPAEGQTVTFTATATPPDGVAVEKYSWDFDADGLADAEGQTATWSFGAPVGASVTLSVTGAGDHHGQAVHVVPVHSRGGSRKAPLAAFTISPAAPTADQPVLFTSTSTDSDGRIREQVWDLDGNGNFDNGGGATALRVFPAAGDYVVGLRVTDNDGLRSFDSQTVHVLPLPGTPAPVQLAGLRLLSPFPVVRIAGRITRHGTRVRLLRVSAPLGARIAIHCNGRSCPFKRKVRAITPAQPRAALSLRVRRLERLLLPGVRVRLYVTQRGAIGKYTKIRFRRGKAPVRTDRCLIPGAPAPVQCPAG